MARPIDADALIKRFTEIKESGVSLRDAVYLDGVMAVIDTASTLSPWVSVEERMPEDDFPEGTNRLQIKVLVAIKAKNGYTVRTQNRIRQEQSWSNKEPFTDWYWKFSHGEVTHWMPLPAPPGKDINVPTTKAPNEPLTQDELREMDGEPVFVKWTDNRILPRWYIVGCYEWNLMDFEEFEDYGKWLAYRRPPEGEAK